MSRHNLVFDEQDAAILEHVFEETKNGERVELFPKYLNKLKLPY
jgi:hypothetical protein